MGHTIHSITSHGTLNALTDLSAHVIDVQREKEGGQRAPLFDTSRGMHPSPLLTIHQKVLIFLIHMLEGATLVPSTVKLHCEKEGRINGDQEGCRLA